MKKIGFISLGCPKNLVDSEVMMGRLREAGYEITSDETQAETLVVNTCGFIDAAKQESINAILDAARLKAEGKCQRLVVAGCLVERYREELRGHFRSRRFGSVVAEAQALVARGVKELILVAQDSSRYGEDLGQQDGLAHLLRELARLEGVEWVRVMYTYPTHISDLFLDVLAREPKAVKYLDMPLQHASQNVLKLMKRGGNRASLERLIERVRGRVPNIAVRTTLITGFPGETEEDFNELLTFMRNVEFDRVGVFTYSDEEGTPAYELPDKVEPRVAKRRRDRLMKEQARISRKRNRARVGSTVRMLFE